VLPHDEAGLLDALARLHAAGEDAISDGSRLVGMFRANGLVVPVWDLPPRTGAAALEEPAAAFERRLTDALADSADLSSEERDARSTLANRQVTCAERAPETGSNRSDTSGSRSVFGSRQRADLRRSDLGEKTRPGWLNRDSTIR
jgi:hypothetical protein